MANGLNHRQELFLAAYLSGPTKGNASASASAAGYTTKPNVQGARLLANASIAARVASHEQLLAETVVAAAIADRATRVGHYQDLADRLLEVFKARGADRSMAKVPGGPTGLLVRQYKQVRRGLRYVIREEYHVDVGPMSEFRALLRQAAEDLGQWTEKRELTGKDGTPLEVQQVMVYLPENGRDR